MKSNIVQGNKNEQPHSQFPSCFPGVSFDTSLRDLISQIPMAMKVFAHGVQAFLSSGEDGGTRDPQLLSPNLSCDGEDGGGGSSFGRRRGGRGDGASKSVWQMGEEFHK